MSEIGLCKQSPLIEKIMGQKFPKLNSDSIKNIVARARQMNKLIQPSGCSQNLKAEFQDPEKALEYSRRKNLIFDSYLKNELGQLNCSKSPVKPFVNRHKRATKSFLPVKREQNSISPVKPQLKSFYSPLTSKKDYSSINTLSKSVNYSEHYILPPLVKSVPLYLDPNYNFPKKNFEEEKKLEKVKHDRMSSLDSVNRQCEEFIPDCKSDIKELQNLQSIKQEEKNRIQEYLNDFLECLKIAKDQKTFEDSLLARVYSRKMNGDFREELDDLRSELLEVSKKAIELGGKKIWRWKNTLFLSNTDKLINSVPSMRK